ncbi:MAG: family 78 glycoside hydrolase catalytic domain, partial [Clostridia bacterium]|nr:family 78 glycoside hydrolase catalytic domain [Clostridia bacterium]
MLSSASWIKSKHSIDNISPVFKKTFTLSGSVKSAVAYASAYGTYNLYLNGDKVGRAIMAPGWTSFKSRIQYQRYDLTDIIRNENTVELECSKGWALGNLGFLTAGEKVRPNPTTENVAVIFKLEIEYTDGRRDILVSDESWEVYTSHIISSELYNGETVDMTAPIERACYAVVDKSEKPTLIPQVGEDIIEGERIAASELIITPKGERVIDFGQNIAGYVEIRYKGKAGDRIRITHAEVFDFDGNFYTDNMRDAKNENIYISDGNENIFKPSFCFQGFRYIRLDEYPLEDVDLSTFTAIAIHSDIKRTGDFVCGYEKLNRLYSNIVWGQLSNYIDVPTDCPQRDERLGWTGDAEVFCRTAAINFNVKRFFEKWLGDVALEQGEDGSVAGVVPAPYGTVSLISAAWGDAATVCPMEIYRAYGDKELLREHFPMMKKWVEYMHSFGEDEYLYIGGVHYGDWVALDAGADQYVGATQTDLIASAYFAYSTELVVKAGKILGEDVSEYEALYKKVREAFRTSFMKDGLPTIYPKGDAVTAKRPIKPITQTGIALILRFGLCEESERAGLTKKLLELIDGYDGRMATGFVGTPHILHALSENGETKRAYDLLLSEKTPSWLFSVNHGATTIWEHWDGMREDGSFWSTDMNSFNHYAYGAVYDWMFGVMVGIDIPEDSAAYNKITFTPHPDKRIGFARASVETALGKISGGWTYLDSGKIRYELSVPTGITA